MKVKDKPCGVVSVSSLTSISSDPKCFKRFSAKVVAKSFWERKSCRSSSLTSKSGGFVEDKGMLISLVTLGIGADKFGCSNFSGLKSLDGEKLLFKGDVLLLCKFGVVNCWGPVNDWFCPGRAPGVVVCLWFLNCC